MADAVDRLAGLPDELVLAIFAGCAPTQLCALAQTCSRLKALSRDQDVWRRCHTARWRHPHQAVAPPPGWRADFARRHVQDARVVGLLRSLKQSDARASEVAWSLLLDLGMEVFDEVLRLADVGEEEAENALLGLNQAAVRAEPTKGDRRILSERPQRDSTPPHLITLLLTDVGVMTASAVADEMLRRQHLTSRRAVSEIDRAGSTYVYGVTPYRE